MEYIMENKNNNTEIFFHITVLKYIALYPCLITQGE